MPFALIANLIGPLVFRMGILIGILFFVNSSQAQASVGKKTIDPKIVQEKAIDSSLDFKKTSIDRELAEIAYKQEFHNMFLPSINISGTFASQYTYAQYPNQLSQSVENTFHAKGFPSSTVSIGFADFTLYNGGKDSLKYKVAYIDSRLSREAYFQKTRETRFAALLAFSKHQLDLEKLDANERYLKLSLSFSKLIKTKLRKNRVDESEYLSSVNDVLEAQRNRDEAKAQAETSLWALNKILGDPIGEEYTLRGKLEYRPLKMTLVEAMEIYKKTAPSFSIAKAEMEKKRIGWEAAVRERLPLPTVTLSPLKLSYTQEYGSSYSTQSGVTGSEASNANLDFGFAVSVSVPIFGESGYFGHRNTKKASLEYSKQELDSAIELQNSETKIRELVQQIRKQESNVSNSKEQLKNAINLLDTLFAKASSNENASTSRLELRDALRSASDVEAEYRAALLDHTSLKFDLANYLGVNLDENADL